MSFYPRESPHPGPTGTVGHLPLVPASFSALEPRLRGSWAVTPSEDVCERRGLPLPTKSSSYSDSKGKAGRGPFPHCLSCLTRNKSWSGDADDRGRKLHLPHGTEMLKAQVGTWYPGLLATTEHLYSSSWASGHQDPGSEGAGDDGGREVGCHVLVPVGVCSGVLVGV